MNAAAAADAPPPLPPRDADPAADAEAGRIAAVVDRCVEWFVRPDAPEETAAATDEKILIPMAGQAESLNAAVSAAILLYEAVRQRTLYLK